MNDFMVHVDRAAIGFQRQFDDIHSAHHARTETSRPDAHQRLGAVSTVSHALYMS